MSKFQKWVLTVQAALLLATAVWQWNVAGPWSLFLAISPVPARVVASQAVLHLSADYLREWRPMEPNFVALLDVSPEYTLCYRLVEKNAPPDLPTGLSGGYLLECVLRENATERVSPVLSAAGFLFARDLGEAEYGLLFDKGLLVFDRATQQPLRLERDVALLPSDIVSPDYLNVWVANMRDDDHDDSNSDTLGPYELCYVWEYPGEEDPDDSSPQSAAFDCYVQDPDSGDHSLLLRISAFAPRPLIWQLYDGSSALFFPAQDWLLTLDAATAEPLALYGSLEELGLNGWRPVAAIPYLGGTVELGAKPDAEGKLLCAVAINRADGTLERMIETDLPFYDLYYFAKDTPTLHLYGDQLMFDDYIGLESISLLDGTVVSVPGLVFFTENGGAVTYSTRAAEGSYDPSEEAPHTITVWKNGLPGAPVSFPPPEGLYSSYASDWEAVTYDEAQNAVVIQLPDRIYTIYLTTGESFMEPVPS